MPSFSVCVLGWRKDLRLEIFYRWYNEHCTHSGVACLEVDSFSKLSLNNLVANDSYMKRGGDLHPDFCGKYMVTHALSTEMKIGSDPCKMWISDMAEAGWHIYVILLV